MAASLFDNDVRVDDDDDVVKVVDDSLVAVERGRANYFQYQRVSD
jgi:hypothetical protein